MISSGDEKAVNIYSEEGKLISTIELPEDHKVCGVAFHYGTSKIIVLTYVENKDSYFLLYHTEAGELETKTLFCNNWSEFPQITSHPSGYVAVVRWRGRITFI
jgi:antitoxin component YwqK of YwqJK toxin-antitoxin module